MKILVWVCLFLTCAPVLPGPGKKALLIGIGAYKEGSKWPRLNGDSDVSLMKETLNKQGFSDANVATLTNEEATRIGIENTVNRLISGAKEGDQIVILFSGHGKQVQDKNGDEVHDGRDEAIAPFDSEKDSDKNLIIDDRLDEWITALRKNVTSKGHVVLLLNSCHSGTGSKGNDPESINDCGEGTTVIKQANKSRNTDLGKFIAIEASFSQNTTQQIKTPDGREFGALTYSVAVAFEHIKRNETYLTFFENVYQTMYRQFNFQRPCLEGASQDLNVPLFNGEVVEKPIVYQLQAFLTNQWKVFGGYLQNINVGDIFEFRANKAKGNEGNEPITRGEVIKSGAFESEIRIIEGKVDVHPVNIIGFPTDMFFANYQLGVSLGKLTDKKLQHSLANRLASKNIISLAGKTPELELTEDRNQVIITSLSAGSVWTKLKKDADLEDKVVCRLIDYARARFLANLDVKNPEYRAAISLKHCVFDTIFSHGVKSYKPNFYSDKVHPTLVFDTTQQSLFTIRNTGNKPFYFALLDIQPDGRINWTLPDAAGGWKAEHIYLEAGEEKSFPFGSPTPPYGMEMFKVILSPTVEDFGFLRLQTCAAIPDAGVKGGGNPMVALLKDVTEGALSRTKAGRIPMVGGTAELVFKIIPPPGPTK